MLNPVIRETYSENVIDILEHLRTEIEPLGIQCELYGKHVFSEGSVVPEMLFINEINGVNILLKECVSRLWSLVPPNESEVYGPTAMNDSKIWNKHLEGKTVRLWVK